MTKSSRVLLPIIHTYDNSTLTIKEPKVKNKTSVKMGNEKFLFSMVVTLALLLNGEASKLFKLRLDFKCD